MSEDLAGEVVDVASFVHFVDGAESGVRYFMPETTVQVGKDRLGDPEVARWILNTSPIRPIRSEHVSAETWDGVVVEAR